jgi:tripartite ATP-independent transporter DctM subunit
VTDPQLALAMLGLFIFIIMLGFPIAFTLMAMGVAFGFYAYYTPDQSFFDNRVFYLFTQNTFSVMNSDILVAIPLFLFMGYMIERSNILDQLFLSLQVAFRRVPGAMAIAALVTCALFATATGIVGAVVTLMGLLAFPAMLKARYDQSISAGVICAGGTLGILIPPSIMLIVYGATAGVSVVKLYAAALIPGFMLAGLYMLYVVARAVLSPKLMPSMPADENRMSYLAVVLLLLKAFFPLAVLIMSVLGAILFGLATPSEAAAIGALGSVVLAVGYRAMSWGKLRETVFLTARTSAMVCYLFVGSWLFSSIFSYLGGEHLIKEFVLGLNLNTVTFLLLTQLIIFLLGWPLEWSEIIIIFVPIFLPLLQHFDVDPIFFGILVALNLQTSFLTPPMAMSAYYLKGVAPPSVLLSTIFKGCLPFVSMVFLAMAMIYIFPALVTWLPEVLYSR